MQTPATIIRTGLSQSVTNHATTAAASAVGTVTRQSTWLSPAFLTGATMEVSTAGARRFT